MANVYPGTEIPSEENVKTYWKNICSLPRDNNPSIDNDGERDQPFNTLVKDPNIFYLSSQREGTGQRKVKVPEGMKIFIPVLGVVATNFESQNSTVPQPDLKALAQLDQDSIRQLSVEINGQEVPLAVLDNYRVPTNEFDVEFPDYPQAIFPGYGAPRESKAVADGRYLIIEPLSKGKELIIHIKGNILVDAGKKALERGFNEDLTYTLTC
jgi:hypothetical protein